MKTNEKHHHMKKSFGLLAFLGLLTVAGCQAWPPATAGGKGPDVTLKIGVIDPICRKSACSCVSDAAKRAFEGMNAKLLRESGITLEMEYFEDPQLLDRALREGQLDGMIGKYTTCGRFARGSKREFVRLADITEPSGKADLRGVFITYKGSPVKTLEQIPQHRLGLGFQADTEKYFLPLETLKNRKLAVAAENRLEFFDCKSAALALMEQRVDVAVISDYALEYGCIVVVGDPKDFQVIGRTDRALPFTTFMVDAKRVPADARRRLAAGLLSITGVNVPEDLFSKGWVKPIVWPKDIPEP